MIVFRPVCWLLGQLSRLASFGAGGDDGHAWNHPDLGDWLIDSGFLRCRRCGKMQS